MQDKQSEFAEAVKKLLSECELVPAGEADRRISLDGIDYIRYVGNFVDSDGEPRDVLMPYKSWYAFLAQINRIFGAGVSSRTTEHALSKEIFKSNVFPPSGDTLEKYTARVFEALQRHSEVQAEALVPLYNIYCGEVLEMPLANTTFCSGHDDSSLARLIKENHQHIVDQDIGNHNFLRVKVNGDDESRLTQVELEVERALIVLRFVRMWKPKKLGSQYIPGNPGAMRPVGKRLILFSFPDAPIAWRSDIDSNFIQIDKDSVNRAHDNYGLDDLNYHYQNADKPESKRVCRALEFYDSGTRAFTNWQAMYRYATAINVALDASGVQKDNLKSRLKSLIENGGNYIEPVRNRDETTSLSWDNLVTKRSDEFENFYTSRSQILHGNIERIEDPNDQDVEYARILAHNTVRLKAKLARNAASQTKRIKGMK